MLTKGPAKKVTIFLNEDTQRHMTALHDAIMTFLLHKGVAGATATRAYSGFGSHQSLHTPDVELLAQHLPIRIEFIDTKEKVDEVLPTLYEMVSDGLIEVQDTNVVKLARTGVELGVAEAAAAKAPNERKPNERKPNERKPNERKPNERKPNERRQAPAKLLRVFIGEADKSHGEPLYEAIVKRLVMMDIAGATVYRGVLGYGAKGHQHKATFFHPVRDLPIMISVVDTPEKIAAAAEVIEELLEDGLIVTSDVEMVRLLRKIDVPALSS